MYLKHLSINGFKSFAKKGELEFSSAITAIVGPNGSGKSNVAESFRFVLGEQSPSRMRGKKGEDLIWGGSDSLARGNRASVAVTLDNEKHVFPVDFDEIVLERVVHRDGANEYLINGSQVRLKDVQELLAAANIGPSGHHIISQGEADRILSASPKERREMIEDALGLKVYQFKKTEAVRKLDKTRENIDKVDSLRREVAPHLRFLEKQMKKIERAVELRDQLRHLYAEYLKREDTYLAYHQDRLEGERNNLKKELETKESALTNAKAVLAKEGSGENRTELIEAENTLTIARRTKQDIVRAVATLEGQLSFLERRIRAARDRSTADDKLQIPYGELDKLVTSLEWEVQKAVKNDDVSVLRRAMTDVVHTLRQFLSKASLQGERSSIVEEEREYEDLTGKKNELDKQLATASQDEIQAEEQHRAIRTKIENSENEGRAAEREVFRLGAEKRECENVLVRLEYEYNAIVRDRDEFKRELQEAVILIGRNAADYFKLEITGDIVNEDRARQIERRRELEKLKIRLEEQGGGGEEIEKEYTAVKERDDFLIREVADLKLSVEKLEQLIAELNAELNERFSAGIDKISLEFNKFFALMFGGGAAELNKVKMAQRRRVTLAEEELLTEESPETEEKTEEGIEIGVKLPNKRVKGLDMLSGGERALTSIALIFAMSQVNPPLFIILDETDAALDEANSRRYGDMIEALSKRSQLILITHNRETMSRAGILYGVTMGGDGVSKLLSVRLDQALAVAK
ncbi:hypothetical protein A2837_01635 [Candidatus Kaiserbacteria bacterium RIFCSPHIGHO2_01_FULL_46_22]|uniref:RecF/RecN/SMC N-terminal domain-containing protein n=1 Tax=Candidatus Kaiserbacteria bacterium RIFCSPHIGHO2_01_FULL_46_22 TaxID=1798475 RepID=A0A1F6BY66_9BACT|nr:MAG: hypothetical protein A2837_01635 [Candidatus Kaiserbacteria bacterium RIFCSPHIGHO2_01_FULL_46_22]